MSRLPSGIHFCIDSRPLDDLLRSVRSGQGLFIPDLLLIHDLDDLRRHMQMMWLLPLGADCAINPALNPLSAPVPAGLTMVDSGHTMNRLPDHLDERDRHALSLFWESPRCRAFLEQQMDKVRSWRNRLFTCGTPEDWFIVQWFPRRSAARAELIAALEEEMAESTAISHHI